jgi:hypothetical protein
MSERHRHHHDKHGSTLRRESRIGSFLRAYLFEIIGAIVIALGVFLVMERMSIRSTLSRWAAIESKNAQAIFGQVDAAAGALVARIELSDIVGIVLILAAVIVVTLRVRWRLMRMPSLTTLSCPRCEGGLHRVHRHRRDRLVSLIVPVRRYRCSNPECRWCGIRVVSSKQGQEAAAAAPPSPPAAQDST